MTTNFGVKKYLIASHVYTVGIVKRKGLLRTKIFDFSILLTQGVVK